MVRIGFPGGPRLDWYDRDPSSTDIGYTGVDVAPHSSTQRASYTVPTGKKAWVQSLSAWIKRTAVATTLGYAKVTFYCPTGVAQRTLHNDNTDESEVAGFETMATLIMAGEVCAIYTSDSSTGGTVSYIAGMRITEFSA